MPLDLCSTNRVFAFSSERMPLNGMGGQEKKRGWGDEVFPTFVYPYFADCWHTPAERIQCKFRIYAALAIWRNVQWSAKWNIFCIIGITLKFKESLNIRFLKGVNWESLMNLLHFPFFNYCPNIVISVWLLFKFLAANPQSMNRLSSVLNIATKM